jgi:DNA-binding MarR family transcriptional regulator
MSTPPPLVEPLFPPPVDVAALPPAVARNAGFLLSKLSQRATAIFEARLAPLGLRVKHHGVLSIVETRGGESQQAIGECLGIDPSSMVALVDHVERLGLIVRRRDPDDRRRYVFEITDEGRAMLERTRAAATDAEAAVLAGLDDDEQALLRALMTKALAGIQRAAP